MVTIALSLFGLPDFWSGVLLTVAALVVLIWLVFSTDFFEHAPWPFFRERYEDFEAEHQQRRITGGVLICDWADMQVLATVAKQKQVEPDPDRMERGEANTTGGMVEGGGRRGILRGKLSRERKRDERAYYELTKDTNALLVRVLRKLLDDHAITTDVDSVWGPNLLGGEMLDDVIHIARDKPQVEAAREAVRALQAAAVEQHKAEEWSMLAAQPRFVLIESEWEVGKVLILAGGDGEPEHYELRLRKLRQGVDYSMPHEIYDSPSAGQPIDMPNDLRLVTRLTPEQLTEQGKSRMRDKGTITAGVFGTTATFERENGTLVVTPIAVFARVDA